MAAWIARDLKILRIKTDALISLLAFENQDPEKSFKSINRVNERL